MVRVHLVSPDPGSTHPVVCTSAGGFGATAAGTVRGRRALAPKSLRQSEG